MSEQISNLPERIYLVFEYAEPGDDFRDFPEVSWCSDRISDSDVEYVRATRITEHQLELAARKPSVADIPEAELIKRAIRNARARGYGPAPLWSIVMDIFALGSTYAAQLCIAHGFDPDAPI